MNKIFCLETEWDQTIHDLKKKSTVLSLLDFLQNAQKKKIEYIHSDKSQHPPTLNIIFHIYFNRVMHLLTIYIYVFMDAHERYVLQTKTIAT